MIDNIQYRLFGIALLPREIFPYTMLLQVSGFVLFVIVSNEKWEEKLRYKTVRVDKEIDD